MSTDTVFGGVEPLFVTDCAEAVDWLLDSGRKAVSVDAAMRLDAIPDAIVFAGADYTTLDTVAVQQRFARAATLWSPVGSFNGSALATIYSLERLFESDLAGAIRRNREWMEFYAETDGPVRILGDGTDITCWMSDPLFVATRDREQLSPGEWASVGSYLEVNCETAHKGQMVFNVTGRLHASGMLAARHRLPTHDAVIDDHASATAFVEDIGRSRRDVVIEFENSMLTGCWVDGADRVDFMRDLAGPVLAGRITEFAAGTNISVLDSLDWSVNSQLNEGVGGIHIGIGDGLSGVHFDFVAPDAERAA